MSKPAPDTPADPGIALALGSSFLGVYAHGGFLCGLNEAGIHPGHVAGASAGAIAGGFYAAGFRGDRLRDAVLSPELKQSYPDPGMVFRGAPMFFIGRLTGLMNGKRVIRHLSQELECALIEDATSAKLSIAVTDLRKLEAKFLTAGPLAQAIMASCSVPVLFTGQTIAGTEFHDGGILHELPLEPFIEDPAIHTIIIHAVTNPKRSTGKNLGVSSAFSHSHKMLNRELTAHRKKVAEKNGKRVIFFETNHPHPGLLQSAATKQRYFVKGRATGLSMTEYFPL